MKDKQTYSWIFLSVAIASQNNPTNLKEITNVADGINHVIPTENEIKNSVKWLSEKGLITKHKNKYMLTEKGKNVYEEVSQNKNQIMRIWSDLEITLKNYA